MASDRLPNDARDVRKLPRPDCEAASIISQAIAVVETLRAHSFESACARNDIDHRLTKPRHAWTNGQFERMNRTIKDATVKRYHYDSREQLSAHLADLVSAYDFDRRLKTLGGCPLRGHPQSMVRRARALQVEPAPPDAWTEHGVR